MNILHNETLRLILQIIQTNVGKKSSPHIALDIGCGKGYFSRVLSLQFTTIGLDIGKGLRSEFKSESKKINFVLADMHAMPFRKHSIDIVVCISVLEHCQNLENLMKEIKDVLRKDGIFIAGYPVETKFLKLVWKLISPDTFKFIDRTQTYWCNPYSGKQECYWESPSTHKQDYRMIRTVLRRSFKSTQKEGLPFNILPDSLMYYECMYCAGARNK